MYKCDKCPYQRCYNVTPFDHDANYDCSCHQKGKVLFLCEQCRIINNHYHTFLRMVRENTKKGDISPINK